ncbi:hypothetical protein ACS386_00075 [Flavobacteriaceae bacterium LMO-SS05]
MKKVLIILLALVTLQVTAQDKKKALHKDGSGDRMEALKDLSPEEMATLQTKKMTLHLDLTVDQQKKIQALNLNEAKLRKTKMDERRAMRERGEKKTLTKEEKLNMMNSRLDHQIARKQKMKSILNAEQYTKWEASQGKMEHRREGKHQMMKHQMSEEKDKQ